MIGSRPPVSALAPVGHEELVLRIVNLRVHYNRKAPLGSRLATSALQSKEYEPGPDNYGASAWVVSKLLGGERALYEAEPKWEGSDFTLCRFTPLEVAQWVTSVRYSPHDSDIAHLRDAHASLIGITKQGRVKLVRFFEDRIGDLALGA